ncbi:hypothetical protein K438DRAFT_1770930 [Mycena galopus ATCC 62051]|nr:hypothetical protein K438DRAFT_1770930 [Mycena galopus ATCC 62051]
MAIEKQVQDTQMEAMTVGKCGDLVTIYNVAGMRSAEWGHCVRGIASALTCSVHLKNPGTRWRKPEFLSRNVCNKDDWSTSNPGLDSPFPGKQQYSAVTKPDEESRTDHSKPETDLSGVDVRINPSPTSQWFEQDPFMLSTIPASGQSTFDPTQRRSKQYTDALRDQESKIILEGNLQFQAQKKWVKDSRPERSQRH